MIKETEEYINQILASTEASQEIIRVNAADEKIESDGEILTALAVVLCDFEIMKAKTLGLHWNTEGPNFLEYHDYFEELWNDFHSYADLIAERIRQLKSYTPTSLQEFLSATRLDERSLGKTDGQFEGLVSDLTSLEGWLDSDITMCGEKNDIVTQDILIGINRSIQKTKWFIKSILGD